MDRRIELPEKLIIIGGLPRSGKTMLSNVIGSNSQIAIPQSGFGFFNFFSEEQYKSRGGFNENLDFFFDSCWKSKSWKINRKMVVETGCERKDLYVVLLDTYRKAYFPERKYPGVYDHVAEEHFDKLVDWFGHERLKFIHPVRDPFDNYGSYVVARKIQEIQRNSRLPDAFVYRFCRMWGLSTTMGTYRSLKYPDSYRVVYFNEFKEDPIASVESLCKWIGVPVEVDNMLNMVNYNNKKQNSAFELKLKQEKGIGFVKKDKYDRREHLYQHELDAIRAISCPNLLHAIGYEKQNVIVNWKSQEKVVDASLYALNLNTIVKSYLSVIPPRQVLYIYLRHLLDSIKDILFIFLVLQKRVLIKLLDKIKR